MEEGERRKRSGCRWRCRRRKCKEGMDWGREDKAVRFLEHERLKSEPQWGEINNNCISHYNNNVQDEAGCCRTERG